ncbi:MAG: spermidine/putrescine transport system permease protein [Gaiellales bacterium]|jgi:spermidine/putrescine transport system permease protein|nr:spermidine/putrescine transport system permease protein [Gaiellales bacterium]
MAATTETSTARRQAESAAPAKPPSNFWRKVRYQALNVFAGLVLLYLFLPISIIILFSFNDPAGKFNVTWQKFSLDAWAHPLSAPGLQDAVILSMQIAFGATIVATALGTLIALGLARHNFFGRSTTNFLIFTPMATPEIVMGSSLLTLFIATSYPNLGLWTILIAHIVFCISYVVVTVKARVHGLERALEEAAMDLYANAFTTFRKITLPLIMPGVAAAAALAFALSIDDFVVTQFNSGSEVTFPLYIYGAARNGVPVQVNVIGSMIFLVAVGGMFLNLMIQSRKAKRDMAASAGAVRRAQAAEASS